MSDRERLAGYVDVWWEAVDDFTRLLESLPAEEWSTPTDLVGWDVHDCAAHTAHLEAVLVRRARGDPRDRGRPARPDPRPGLHRAGRGRPPRRDAGRADQRDPRERHQAPHLPAHRPAGRRHRDAAEDAGRHPVDLADAAPQPAAGRVDARAGRTPRGRPPGRPRHRAGTAHRRLPARGDGHGARQACRGSPGSTLVVEVDGSAPAAFGIADSGRGGPLPERPARPDRAADAWTARPSCSSPAAGAAPATSARVSGDVDLAARILEGMAITP